MAAEGRHVAHLLHSGADDFFARIEVTEAEESLTASALTVRGAFAARNAAGPRLILTGNEGTVLHVDGEIVSLGDAVLARADLFALIAHLTVLRAERTAAVDAEADRGPLAAGKLAEKAFLYLAVLGMYVWHFFHALIWRQTCPSSDGTFRGRDW
jgi:hypothetical protein